MNKEKFLAEVEPKLFVEFLWLEFISSLPKSLNLPCLEFWQDVLNFLEILNLIEFSELVQIQILEIIQVNGLFWALHFLDAEDGDFSQPKKTSVQFRSASRTFQR